MKRPLREHLLMDNGWRFSLGHAADAAKDFEFARSRCLVKAGEARGAAGFVFDDKQWRTVDLPHDWVIELPFDPKGDKELAEHGFRAVGPDHPENSIGWYRREFEIPKTDLGRRVVVEFDGVFRDSIVWVNGHRLGRHESGYTSFRYDLTDFLNYGGRNVLAVRNDATSWEGWWYEGGGIYRHVWLVKTSPLHVAPCGTFVTSRVAKSDAIVSVQTKIVNDGFSTETFYLIAKIRDSQGKEIGKTKSRLVRIAPGSEIELKQNLRVRNPKLWSCETPELYHLESTLHSGGNDVDVYETPFGIRTLRWDEREGFFLNGKHVLIKGTCNHQQHAGLGIALPDALQELRIRKLKDLGSNAYRCSHYAATPELLDACDRHGMLVMAENRLGSSSPEVQRQFESMIVRDRNHPSIILWSLANEEHTVQWAIAGERIGRRMVDLAHRLDPTRKVTAAMHDRGLGEGFANIVDVHGWNYIKVGDLEGFHKRRPEQPIVGSEEGSTVCTRGIYKDDKEAGYVSAYDLRAPKWGSTAESWWTYFTKRPWLAGAFVWTGFDYYGEPIPYQWPCTASHFGLMDLCGFPKDNYYYFKSWWSEQPVLHLLPHWNWPGKEGEPIDVRCFGNCEEVELLLNNQPMVRQAMSTNSHLAWNVHYRPGRLVARGFRKGKLVAESVRETSGEPTQILLIADRKQIRADGEDVAMIQVSVKDAHGRDVPLANQLINFEIVGRGRLIGVGNGDPSSHESDKEPFRKLFNGLAMALVQSNGAPGEIHIRATSPGLGEASIILKAAHSRIRPRA